jgi:hypothetical protein
MEGRIDFNARHEELIYTEKKPKKGEKFPKLLEEVLHWRQTGFSLHEPDGSDSAVQNSGVVAGSLRANWGKLSVSNP